MRKLLVQCAHDILGPFGPDCDLRRWGLELAGNKGWRRCACHSLVFEDMASRPPVAATLRLAALGLD